MSREQKHTPGPWEKRGEDVSGRLFLSHREAGENLSHIIFESVSDADYNLIAITPDMLEALERASKQLDVFEGESVSRTEARNAVRAIIAKVKGGNKA